MRRERWMTGGIRNGRLLKLLKRGGKSKNDSLDEAKATEKGRTTSESVSLAEDVPGFQSVGWPYTFLLR
jgi:hypothetical protein